MSTLFAVLLVFLVLSYWMAYSLFADREEFVEYMQYDGSSEDMIRDYELMCDAWDGYGFLKKNLVASTFLMVTLFEVIRGR